jgi:fructose-1,6-bisphosphatase/sedoheptulose 1,7-bisphosphatase-like protein
MEKIIVGPAAKGAVDLDAPVKHNLKAIARRGSAEKPARIPFLF